MTRLCAPAHARARRAARYICGCIAILGSIAPLAAHAAPIDFNLLFHDPGAPIQISADGSSAVLSEDPAVFAVFLSNVPGFGDPQLITAATGARLSFDYAFNEPAGNADIFHFALLDGSSGEPLAGEELFVTDTGAGTASFDLSAFVNATLGMQFELVPDLLNDFGFDSTLTLSNLRIDVPVATPVDEPNIVELFFLCFASVLMWKGRRADVRA